MEWMALPGTKTAGIHPDSLGVGAWWVSQNPWNGRLIPIMVGDGLPPDPRNPPPRPVTGVH